MSSTVRWFSILCRTYVDRSNRQYDFGLYRAWQTAHTLPSKYSKRQNVYRQYRQQVLEPRLAFYSWPHKRPSSIEAWTGNLQFWRTVHAKDETGYISNTRDGHKPSVLYVLLLLSLCLIVSGYWTVCIYITSCDILQPLLMTSMYNRWFGFSLDFMVRCCAARFANFDFSQRYNNFWWCGS